MAMTPKSSSSRQRSNRRFMPLAEMNVTPMVDVMLVLLVIFMVSAPLLTTGVPVDLPSSQARSVKEISNPLIITLNVKGQIFLKTREISQDHLLSCLQEATRKNIKTPLYIRADKNLPYGQVMRVMGLLSQAGYKKVALISDKPKNSND